MALIARLDLLAKRDFTALKKICGVGDEDLVDMIAEVRRLNPKPGHAFGSAPVQPILMRDGDHATLVFENAAIRISLPVICLQSGSRGQKVRVVSADHKRYFTGEILESGLLRAAL